MTTLKKASTLFLSLILSGHPPHLCYVVDRILSIDTHLDLYRFMAIDGKLRHFGDLIERQSYLGCANSN